MVPPPPPHTQKEAPPLTYTLLSKGASTLDLHNRQNKATFGIHLSLKSWLQYVHNLGLFF